MAEELWRTKQGLWRPDHGVVRPGLVKCWFTSVNKNSMVIKLLNIREFYSLDLPGLLDLKPFAFFRRVKSAELWTEGDLGHGSPFAQLEVFRAALDEVSRRCGGFVVHPAESSSCELQGGGWGGWGGWARLQVVKAVVVFGASKPGFESHEELLGASSNLASGG